MKKIDPKTLREFEKRARGINPKSPGDMLTKLISLYKLGKYKKELKRIVSEKKSNKTKRT